MAATEQRYAIERAKWDSHAASVEDTILPGPDVDFYSYATKQTLLPGMAEFLGDLTDKRVVEYGCGLGAITVHLARSGAQVSAFDISERSIEVARERARMLGLHDRISFAVAPGERLPYDDASFDAAFGKAVLHHLDPIAGAAELARILRPGARAAFSEPLGTNPIVQAARDHVPYPGKHERGADIPLRRSDIEAWTAPFARSELRGVQLFSMIERGLGHGKRIPPLRELDRMLLKRWPAFWPLCRYGVLLLER